MGLEAKIILLLFQISNKVRSNAKTPILSFFKKKTSSYFAILCPFSRSSDLNWSVLINWPSSHLLSLSKQSYHLITLSLIFQKNPSSNARMPCWLLSIYRFPMPPIHFLLIFALLASSSVADQQVSNW